jgi:hypothetical protein
MADESDVDMDDDGGDLQPVEPQAAGAYDEDPTNSDADAAMLCE